ncbi:MAG: hypothetical protein APF80_09070 [Alphaproteobacteria bacterium BRH_c36]|nr:MAG: hypothetical protein APF80_09070 [Alphaproteobacteria bacterium BRH_c36]
MDMNGGNKVKYNSLAALAAAGLLLSVGGASAADLGGDCCADLEERVAELEATTARKGNRKVSLTITGWVSEGIMWWDDGTESNVYVAHDSTDLASNVSFTGTANINSDVEAGYQINIFFDHANALFQTQDNDNANFGVNLQRAFWWLKSNTLGKVSIGMQSAAADNATILTDFTGTLFQHNTVTFEGTSMALTPEGGTRSGANNVGFLIGRPNGTLGALLNCNTYRQGIANDCLGDRTNSVRYDTPTFAGFSASASWGEDDRYEGTVRYAGEGGGFKYAFATSYGEVNGDNDALGSRTDFLGNPIDAGYFQIGGTIKHLASALWFHGHYGTQDTDNAVISPGDGEAYYLKAGWSPKLNSLGTTHFIGEFRQNLDTYGASYQVGSGDLCGAYGVNGGGIGAACGAAAAATDVDAVGSEVTSFGLGLVQEIDAASMNLWIKYRHFESEIDFRNTATGARGTQDFQDIDLVFAGAHIFF